MKQVDPQSPWNTVLYPLFLSANGNWHIHANENGECASIAVRSGCRSSAFGDLKYADITDRRRNIRRRFAAAIRRSQQRNTP